MGEGVRWRQQDALSRASCVIVAPAYEHLAPTPMPCAGLRRMERFRAGLPQAAKSAGSQSLPWACGYGISRQRWGGVA